MLDSGSKYGRLTVLEDQGYKKVRCVCSCGNRKVVARYNLTSGSTKSCGCLKSEALRRKWSRHSKKTAIPRGTRFGRLEVLHTERQYALCRCGCGTEKRIYKYDLLNGKTRSCGCLLREVSAENLRKTSTKHGDWNSKEWRSWRSMVKRCTAEYETGYQYWGGRGVTVCDRWLGTDGYLNFLKDMGRAPSKLYFLDRIDSDGNYESNNVRWATAKTQARNRRNSIRVKAFGKTQTVPEWSEETGIGESTIRYRIRTGWSSEDAVSVTPDVRNRRGKI